MSGNFHRVLGKKINILGFQLRVQINPSRYNKQYRLGFLLQNNSSYRSMKKRVNPKRTHLIASVKGRCTFRIEYL